MIVIRGGSELVINQEYGCNGCLECTGPLVIQCLAPASSGSSSSSSSASSGSASSSTSSGSASNSSEETEKKSEESLQILKTESLSKNEFLLATFEEKLSAEKSILASGEIEVVPKNNKDSYLLGKITVKNI